VRVFIDWIAKQYANHGLGPNANRD
jgi:hypothetical protein